MFISDFSAVYLICSFCSYCISVRRPSLQLYPSVSERRFSRVPESRDRLMSIAEIPEKYSIQVGREMYTQLDIDDKYVEDEEKKRPLSARMKAKLRCTKSKCYHFLVYILPIIAVVKNYEFKKFVLGVYLGAKFSISILVFFLFSFMYPVKKVHFL